MKNRENLRFARTRIYGLLRELLRAVGEDFATEGLVDRADDIFYLTLDEVWDFVKGRAVTTNLKGLAALRRAEFDALAPAGAAPPTVSSRSACPTSATVSRAAPEPPPPRPMVSLVAPVVAPESSPAP